MSDRIGIIGDPDSILAFKAIGVEVFSSTNDFEAKELIKEMARKNFKVIFISEKIAMGIEDFLNKYKSKTYPAIIPIPTGKPLNYGMKGIKRDMEKAIGADILFKENN